MRIPVTHWVIFVIVIVEIVMFCNQTLSYLARPHEKKRLFHIILIGLLILYNIAETLFVLPDKIIPIPIVIQGILSESFGYFVTAYIPFYSYKTMDLTGIRFHARYGFLFIVMPAIFFFFIWYPIHEDLLLARRYVYIIPGIYGIWALSATAIDIFKKYKADKNKIDFRERLCIFVAVVFWCTQPLVGAFGGAEKWIVGVFGNINFLILNAMFIRQTVRSSKAEYLQLQESNTTLEEKIKEGTKKIKQLAEEIETTFINLAREKKIPSESTDSIDKLTHDMVNLFAIKKVDDSDSKQKEEITLNKFEQNCSKYGLTSREINIVRLINDGHSYKKIGDMLFISEPTVKKHVQNMFLKVDVSNKVQLLNRLF